MAEVYFDRMGHQFVLKDGTPITNLQIMDMSMRMDRTPIQTMGSSQIGYVNGPPECTVTAFYEMPSDEVEPAIDAVKKADMKRVMKEIRETFIK